MRKLLFLPVLALAACGHADVRVEEGQAVAEITVTSNFPAPVALEVESLPRLLKISPSIYSGAQPHTAASFAALRELGIKTIVSVDAAPPNLEAAGKEGLRYLHVPIGYDGISQAAGDSYFRLMAEVDLPVYFHCHHGRQRGPAAAAIALRASTQCDAATALAVLEAAGTSHKYEGLWRDVEAWMAPRPDKQLPELVSLQKLNPFVVKMAEIDRTWDRIKQIREQDWKSASFIPETQLLLEQLEECAGHIPAEHIQDKKLHRGLEDVVRFAESFHRAAEALDKDLLEEGYRDLRASCNDCHADYRNH